MYCAGLPAAACASAAVIDAGSGAGAASFMTSSRLLCGGGGASARRSRGCTGGARARSAGPRAGRGCARAIAPVSRVPPWSVPRDALLLAELPTRRAICRADRGAAAAALCFGAPRPSSRVFESTRRAVPPERAVGKEVRRAPRAPAQAYSSAVNGELVGQQLKGWGNSSAERFLGAEVRGGGLKAKDKPPPFPDALYLLLARL